MAAKIPLFFGVSKLTTYFCNGNKRRFKKNSYLCHMFAKLLISILLSGFHLQVEAQKVVDLLQYVPAAATIGLDYCGIKARHPLRERIAMTVTAYATMTATVGALKLTITERRPNGHDDRAFPSGHAARAFTGAELVRTEYGWKWGAGAYALATAVGIMRVADDYHYMHDVVAGALIGVVSARVACWLLPYERRLLGWDQNDVAVSAVPTFDYGTRTIGLALTATLP